MMGIQLWAWLVKMNYMPAIVAEEVLVFTGRELHAGMKARDVQWAPSLV